MLLASPVRCPGRRPLSSRVVNVVKSVLKRILKSIAIAMAVSAVAKIATRVRAKSSSTPVSYDQWPDVPDNPTA